MFNEAKKYLGADRKMKLALMDMYNTRCYPHVDSSRKYRIKPNDEWCAMFTTVMANKVGLTSDQFPYEVSVHYQVEWAKKHNRFSKDISTAKPNDLIIYDWDGNGTKDHVGIIVKVEHGNVYAIEGNIKDTVGYRTLPVTSKAIVGVIHINRKTSAEPSVDNKQRIADLAYRTVRGDFGNGEQRKTLLGVDYLEVQKFINKNY